MGDVNAALAQFLASQTATNTQLTAAHTSMATAQAELTATVQTLATKVGRVVASLVSERIRDVILGRVRLGSSSSAVSVAASLEVVHVVDTLRGLRGFSSSSSSSEIVTGRRGQIGVSLECVFVQETLLKLQVVNRAATAESCKELST